MGTEAPSVRAGRFTIENYSEVKQPLITTLSVIEIVRLIEANFYPISILIFSDLNWVTGYTIPSSASGFGNTESVKLNKQIEDLKSKCNDFLKLKAKEHNGKYVIGKQDHLNFISAGLKAQYPRFKPSDINMDGALGVSGYFLIMSSIASVVGRIKNATGNKLDIKSVLDLSSETPFKTGISNMNNPSIFEKILAEND
jgi:hypothetical protein